MPLDFSQKDFETALKDNIKVISFDVFDTAILRNTFRPKDIFDIVESKYNNDFKAKRMLAENMEREKHSGECTLDGVYQALAEIEPTFKDKLEEISKYEIELEIGHTAVHQEIFDLYQSVKDKYRIIFASDMYLKSDILRQMLKNAGYDEHSLYVSGELGVNKAEGGLYDHIVSDLGIKYEEILHIGDNYASDIVMANKKGIKTLYLMNNYDKSHASKIIKSKKLTDLYEHKNYPTSFLTKLLTEKENAGADIYTKVGYYWGIIFYSFTKWVVENSGGKKIFFNSRDGFLPHKIAKCIMGVSCDYVFLSRRSSSLIAFDFNYPINHEKNLYFYNTLRYQRVNTVKQLLDCIGFDSKKVFSQIKKAGFQSAEDNIEPFKHNKDEIHEKTEKLLVSIEPKIYEHCSLKKQGLLEYIDSLNIESHDIFCDIGYNGSIQYCMELLTGIKLDGKYFEVYKRPVQLDCKKEGYLSTGENFTYGYSGLLESIFSAPHGGVVGYNCCEPTFFEDSKERIAILNRVHNGIIEFCLKWHELSKKTNLDMDIDVIKQMVIRFLKEPSLEEAGFGLEVPFDNGSEKALENIIWFNKERIKNGRIVECYNRSYWKEAFLQVLDESEFAGLLKYIEKSRV